MQRWARRFAKTAPWAGLVLPVLLAWILYTPATGRRLVVAIVAKVNASIPGTLSIDRFAIGPGFAIRAEGVALKTPEGAEAMSAKSVAATIDPAALLRGERAVFLDVANADVDLSPDAAGRPAILRALSSGTSQGQTQSGGARFTVDVALHGARLVRHVLVATTGGAVEVAAKPRNLDLDSANLALHFSGEGSQWEMSLDGTAALHEPLERAIVLHAVLAKGEDAIAIRVARVAAGRSLLAIDAGSYLAASPERSGGQAALRIAPADVEFFGGVRPRADLEVQAAAGPVGERLVASATATVASGGSIALSIVREPAGEFHGSGSFLGVSPPAWAGEKAPAGRVTAAIAFARSLDGVIAGRIAAAHGTVGEARIDALELTGRRDLDGALAVVLERFTVRDREDGRWTLEAPARVERRGGSVDVAGLALAGPGVQRIAVDGHWPPEPRRPLVADARAIVLPGLAGEFVESARSLGGTVDAHARLESLPKKNEPAGLASVHWREARYGERGPGDVLLNVRFDGGRAAIALDAAGNGRERLKLTANVPTRVPERDDDATFLASLSGVQLQSLHEVVAEMRGGFAHGRAWFTADAKGREGTLAKLAATAEVDWLRLRRAGVTRTLADIPPLAITLDEIQLAPLASAGILPREAAGKISGAVTMSQGRMHARLLLEGARIRDIDGITVAVSADGDATSARLFTRLRTASGGDGAIGASATIPPRGVFDLRRIDWALRGAVTGIRLGEASGKGKAPPEMRSAPPLEGTVDTSLSLAGRGTAATGWLYARTNELALSGRSLGRLVAAARIGSDGAALWVGGRPPSGGRLAVIARAEGAPASWAARKGGWKTLPVFAAVSARAMPLAPLAAWFKDYGSVAGNADARGVVRGTAGTPDPRLHLEIHDGAVTHPQVGRVDHIELAVTGDLSRVRLEKLVAHGGSGTARATANLVHVAGDWRLTGTVNANRFSLHGEQFAGEIDGTAHVSGGLLYPRLTAEIRIPHGTVRLPTEPAKQVQSLGDHPDFVILDEAHPQIQLVRGTEKPAGGKGLSTEIHLIVPDNFWIKGNDVNVEMKGDVVVRTDPDKPAPLLEGTVEAVRGEAAVAGKRFAVQTALITFPGGPKENGRLDIRAIHEMDDVDRTKVYATVGGSIGDPKIELASDPSLPQNAIASMLFLGSTDPRSRPSSSESPSLAGRAATFVGNYLTAQLRQQLQTVIPVDVLELDQGASGSSATGRLRVGKYIAPGLFLVYAHAFGAAPEEGSNSLQLEYRFARVWNLLSEYTDRNRGSVDVVWRKEF